MTEPVEITAYLTACIDEDDAAVPTADMAAGPLGRAGAAV
jgi:hypothetical protein